MLQYRKLLKISTSPQHKVYYNCGLLSKHMASGSIPTSEAPYFPKPDRKGTITFHSAKPDAKTHRHWQEVVQTSII